MGRYHDRRYRCFVLSIVDTIMADTDPFLFTSYNFIYYITVSEKIIHP